MGHTFLIKHTQPELVGTLTKIVGKFGEKDRKPSTILSK